MVFTKHDSFVKQIIIYLARKEYDLAFSLSKEFVIAFPDDLLSHFLFAKSAFWVHNYAVAIEHGRIAFNMSSGQDLLTTGLLLSSSYYLSNEFAKGYKVLQCIESGLPASGLSVEFEQLMTIYLLAFNNPEGAAQHIKKLYDLNSKYAEDFIVRFLE
ncbi:MAG: hypothetical protein ABII22_01230 [Candidatus Micrarchaeota archaeon]